MKMIYVFKTSVKSNKSVKKITPYLNKLLTASDWNFDLEDCDNILRIDSQMDIANKAIKILHDYGFECEELPD